MIEKTQSLEIRKQIIDKLYSQLGKTYQYGIQIDLNDPNPKAFDCSEFTRWGFYLPQLSVTLPDGACNQYELVKKTPASQPQVGDLGFFKETQYHPTRKVGQIYHVGVIYNDTSVIEARGEPYNRVILRPIIAWRNFVNFDGWYSHPRLAL